MRAAAQVAWERLEVYRRQAELEAERLREALEEAIRARVARAARSDSPAKSEAEPGPARGSKRGSDRLLAGKALLAFDEYSAATDRAWKLDNQLRRAVHKLLLNLYGPIPSLDSFRPLPAVKWERELDEALEIETDLSPPFGIEELSGQGMGKRG